MEFIKSSLNMTISFVQYLIRHGLLAKWIFLTFCDSLAVKVVGIGGLGSSVPAQGSFMPGTRIKCDICDREGNSPINEAN